MKQDVLHVFFAVAICPSVILLLASNHTHGLSVSVENKETSQSCCSSDCVCSSHHSEVHQLSQVIGDRLPSRNSVGSVASKSSVDITELVDNTTCGTWHTPGDSTSCKCGSSLGGIVDCDSSSEKVSLVRSNCMTFGVNESVLVVGRCIYGCFNSKYVDDKYPNTYYPLPSNASELNELCSPYCAVSITERANFAVGVKKILHCHCILTTLVV